MTLPDPAGRPENAGGFGQSPGMELNRDDPWAEPSYFARAQLALSVLQHATETTRAVAIDRAVLALQGATIEEIQRMTI